MHPGHFSPDEAVDRTRALGADALSKLVGHYPWFERDYDEVVASALYHRELERPGYARQIIDLGRGYYPRDSRYAQRRETTIRIERRRISTAPL